MDQKICRFIYKKPQDNITCENSAAVDTVEVVLRKMGSNSFKFEEEMYFLNCRNIYTDCNLERYLETNFSKKVQYEVKELLGVGNFC